MEKKDYEIWLKRIALIASIASILFLATTIAKEGLPSGHDLAAHIVRPRVFVEALHQGQFPVRWVEWFKNGLSHPLFNFYQGGIYYVIAAIYLLIPSFVDSVKIMIILLWWLGAFFMFLYARRFGTLPGALAGVIYAYTPYLLVDIFVRAAYPELAAIVFATGALWASDQLVRSKKPIFVLPLSFFIGAIILCHLPTFVILFPILAGYICVLALNKEATLRGCMYFTLSTVFGFGLASFYVLPATTELHLVKPEFLTSSYYDFHLHFVYPRQLFSTFWDYGKSIPGPNDGMSFQIGILQLIIIAISIALLFYWKRKKKENSLKIHIYYWLFTILYAVFFMLEISLSFWENFFFISLIQYPWRFLMIIIIACPILAAIIVHSFRKIKYVSSLSIFATLFLISILYRTYLGPSVYINLKYFNLDSPDWYKSEGVIKNAHLEPGYLPKEAIQIPSQDLPTVDLPRYYVLKGKARIKEKEAKYHKFLFNVASEEQLVFQLNVHYFPGWKAYIDNKEVFIDNKNPYDYMVITIPPTVHEVTFVFTNTPVRSISNAITLLSITTLLFFQMWIHLKKR